MLGNTEIIINAFTEVKEILISKMEITMKNKNSNIERIPRIIHYCWFGEKPLPEHVQRCIRSWRKYCPDYEIWRWDESNYDYKRILYTDQAYQNRKWAFVSDVARLEIVYKYGGFYLDTDVELIKSLDDLCFESAYMGFEKGRLVNTGLGFGAEKNNPVILGNLKMYDNLNFVNQDGSLNLKPCPVITTDYLKTLGLILEDKMQILPNIKIFPSDYFCPMLLVNGGADITDNTVSIHHFSGTWTTDYEKSKQKKRVKIYSKYGQLGLSMYDGYRLWRQKGFSAFTLRLKEKIKERK